MNAHVWRPACLMAATLLIACGGGGEGGDASTALIPTGGAALASFVEAPLPVSARAVGSFVATNRGLYMNTVVADNSTRILKLHGSPTFNDWSTVRIQAAIAPSHFAPRNVYSEGEREVTFYWSGVDPTPGRGMRWGLYTANAGGVSIDIPDDLGIANVAAGGTDGIIATRAWVRLANGNIHQEDGVYTAANTASDRFGDPPLASPPGTVAPLVSMLAHPSEPLLFFGSGDTLAVYGRTAIQSATQLPATTDLLPFSDFTWYDGQLWFAYGNKVYRRSSTGDLVIVAEMPSDISGYPSGRFCIQGSEVLFADGSAVRISDGRKRSWLYTGELSPEQANQAATLRAKLGAGVYCSPAAQGVYAPTLQSVVMIFPV